MAITQRIHDFSVLESLGFDRQPVGVKFEFFKPKTIERLDKELALCEMVAEAQKRPEPFYMDKDNENCMGKGALGMMEGGEPGWAAAGLIGEYMSIFKDAGANSRCMRNYTLFNQGAVNYVVFARLDCLDFEPDLLIFNGTMAQCEPILRAMSYSTGQMYESKSTPVFACSWIFSYPHLEGKVNFVPMDLGHGSTARKAWEPGTSMVTVPSTWFPVILENLRIMDIVPHAWTLSKEEWLEEEEGIYARIIADAQAEESIR